MSPLVTNNDVINDVKNEIKIIFNIIIFLLLPHGSFYFVIELAAETKVYTLSNLGLKLKELLKQ